MGISLLAPVIIFAFQTLSFHQQIKNGQMMNLSENHPYFVFYNEFQDKTLFVFGISLILNFFFAFIIGLVLSHRIAGPLVKLRKHLVKIADPNEKDHPVYFRDGDFFKEIADAYNLRFKPKK